MQQQQQRKHSQKQNPIDKITIELINCEITPVTCHCDELSSEQVTLSCVDSYKTPDEDIKATAIHISSTYIRLGLQ